MLGIRTRKRLRFNGGHPLNSEKMTTNHLTVLFEPSLEAAGVTGCLTR